MKFILSCWDVLLIAQEPLKPKKSMSHNGDPKLAISIGIYSIEGPDVGFRGYRAHIYIYREREICRYRCTHIYIYMYTYTTCISVYSICIWNWEQPPPRVEAKGPSEQEVTEDLK